MSVAMSIKPLLPHEVHAQQQLLVACEFIKDVHAVNNLLAFEAKRCFTELVRVHVFTRRSCQHSCVMQNLHLRDRTVNRK